MKSDTRLGKLTDVLTDDEIKLVQNLLQQITLASPSALVEVALGLRKKLEETAGM